MRIIDGDALRGVMYHEAFDTDSDMQRWDSGCWIRYKMFEKAIDNAPTVDAVEVVRCRECVYYKDAEFNVFTSHDKWCTYVMNSSYYREPDEYCSKGERREDGNNN